MFVEVVALCYQHHTTRCVVLITEGYNSHKHSQSPLTTTTSHDIATTIATDVECNISCHNHSLNSNITKSMVITNRPSLISIKG